MPKMLEQFPALEALGKELAEYILEQLQKGLQGVTAGDEWVDQYRSPLRMEGQRSSRRHCAIVRRRIALGLPGARISADRKQFFLTTAALAEEMNGGPMPPVKTEPPPPPVDAEESEAYTKVMRIGARRAR